MLEAVGRCIPWEWSPQRCPLLVCSGPRGSFRAKEGHLWASLQPPQTPDCHLSFCVQNECVGQAIGGPGLKGTLRGKGIKGPRAPRAQETDLKTKTLPAQAVAVGCLVLFGIPLFLVGK